MSERESPLVAVVDYGMGNLFSVKRACEEVGLGAVITTSARDVARAAAVIVPGIGAFEDAMATLHRLDLVSVLRDVAASDTPFLGVCLGMQLLMTESHEFGRHRGLGVVEGDVLPLRAALGTANAKVPHVGWTPIHAGPRMGAWRASFLDAVPDGAHMYFVHSFYVAPADPGVVLATAEYGGFEYCVSLRRRNVFACQFHPERSGRQGLAIYRSLARALDTQIPERVNV
jgi:glutamine amidotransferase